MRSRSNKCPGQALLFETVYLKLSNQISTCFCFMTVSLILLTSYGTYSVRCGTYYMYIQGMLDILDSYETHQAFYITLCDLKVSSIPFTVKHFKYQRCHILVWRYSITVIQDIDFMASHKVNIRVSLAVQPQFPDTVYDWIETRGG
jgi:hypothetical protein